MGEPVLTLEPNHVTVEPGGQVRVVVRITNEGSIVEGYVVDVVDEVSGGGRVQGPARWYRVLPSDGVEASPDVAQPGAASVLPQRTAELVIVLAPDPSQRVASGTYFFAVRVTSKVDRGGRAAVEGVVEVGRVHGLQAKLVPVTSKGRWSGRHVVQISNWGNAPARLRLVPSDPDRSLGFLVRPEVVEVPLGGTATARLKVRTRSPSLRGQPARIPFSVRAEPDPPPPLVGPQALHQADPSRPVVDGAFAQRAILSRGVATLAVLALAGGVAATAFAFMQTDDRKQLADSAQPKPPEVSIDSVDATTLRLSWKRIDGASGYKRLRVDPKTEAPQDEPVSIGAAAEAAEVTELKAETEYCFKLMTLTPSASSQWSDKKCTTTDEAPSIASGSTTTPSSTATTTSGTSTPVGSPSSQTDSTAPPQPESFEATDWIVVIFANAERVPGSEADVRKRLAELPKANVKGAKLLLSRSYPMMKPALQTPSWMIYLGPFDSKAAAMAGCQIPSPTGAPNAYSCLAAQPDPAP